MEYFLFFISALMVVLAGTRLAAYGDILATHTTLGYTLVGGVLIATVTSLPEISSSVSAAMIGSPDLAFGNVYGSNAFNVMIIAIADIAQGPGSLLRMVRESHILSSMFGIMMTVISILAIVIAPYGIFEITIGWVSSFSLIIMITYVAAMTLMVRYENKHPMIKKQNDSSDETKEPDNLVLRTVVKFIAMAIIIVISGIQLSVNADIIAENTGLGQTFIGTLLIAGATSLPELVASIAAIRIGAYDMAVGNVLGSNLLNIFIIAITDFSYLQGSVYMAVSHQHLLTAMTTILLSGIVVIGLFYRSKRSFMTMGWDSILVLSGYFMMVYMLFKTSG